MTPPTAGPHSRRPLRFAMVTTFYPPFNFGGDGVRAQPGHALARRGHAVEVIHDADAHRLLGGSADPKPLAEPPGVSVHTLRSPFPVLSCLATQQFGRPIVHGARIRRILSRGFDVIHFHNWVPRGWPTILPTARLQAQPHTSTGSSVPFTPLAPQIAKLVGSRMRAAPSLQSPAAVWRSGSLLARQWPSALHHDRFSAGKHSEFRLQRSI